MHTLIRYVRLHSTYTQLALRQISLYRINALGLVVATVLWSGLNISTVLLTTRQLKVFLGYTVQELIAVGAVQVMFLGIFHAIFTKNIEQMSEMINKGNLDILLLQPVDDQFSVSCRYTRPTALIRVLIGAAMMIYLISYGYLQSPSIPNVALFGLMLGVGNLLLYSMWLMVATLLVWFPSMSNIVELLYAVNVASRYPFEFFREIGWGVALVMFPFSLLLVVPLRVLIGTASSGEVMIFVVTALIFVIASRSFWRFALRHYTSASN